MSTKRFLVVDFRALPLWGAVLPLMTINICYLVAISLDHLPACVPYISGCTSVSSTGRIAPENWIFKAGMFPSAVIVVLVWWRLATFLVIGGQSRFRLVTLRLLGIVAALSLVLFTFTLGLPGDENRLLRRVGTNGFAFGSFTAQVLFIFFYRQIKIGVDRKLWQSLSAVCLALPVLAVAAEVAKSLGMERHAANNIVAWNAFVVSCAYYGLLNHLWQHSEMIAELNSGSRGKPVAGL